MLLWTVAWSLVGIVTIRTINYGRWAGKQGNTRGAIGLYTLSFLTVIIPAFIYYLNNMR